MPLIWSEPNKPLSANLKAKVPFPHFPLRREKKKKKMAFSSNPLSLSVPEHAFETWLRETGYLEIVDARTTQLHRLASSSSAANSHANANANVSTASTSASSRPDGPSAAGPTTTVTAVAYWIIMSIISSMVTLLSLFTLNPLSKLTVDDFSGPTPSWTRGFAGNLDSYSFPSSAAQARMRVHENVKRFARNYATLLILFFACALYQMPLALFGLVLCLALWDFFRFCCDRWIGGRYPLLQQVLVRVLQCACAIILLFSNVQIALVCTLGFSYTAMILHASFRKLTPAKQSPPKGRWR